VKILVTGGGTSGHISPALAVIAELRTRAQREDFELQLLYIGSQNGPERALVEAVGVPFQGVASGKLRRYASVQNLRDALKVPLGIAQSLRAVRAFAPDVILATGGYVAVPPVIAGGMLKRPVVIHEQTTQIGLANRIAARFALKIALSFERAQDELSPSMRSKVVITGNPVRESIFNGDPNRASAWAGFDPQDDIPTLYVTGGSQGARVINRAVEGALPQLLATCRIIHQCGQQPANMEQDFDRLTRARDALPPHLQRRFFVTRFVRDELADVFALCDLALSRAGAGTVAELCALGVPAVYVPLVPTGGDEQTKNARMCDSAGAARIISQAVCNAESVLQVVPPLLANKTQLEAMGRAATTLHTPGAAQRLADLTLSLAHKA
jgi:UDP-N-acetylglucosamine--N-acetylmuramyl-(pentapeptide) pyrophosphoryl-undecaprenol N-acetylglucosamine transferase